MTIRRNGLCVTLHEGDDRGVIVVDGGVEILQEHACVASERSVLLLREPAHFDDVVPAICVVGDGLNLTDGGGVVDLFVHLRDALASGSCCLFLIGWRGTGIRVFPEFPLFPEVPVLPALLSRFAATMAMRTITMTTAAMMPLLLLRLGVAGGGCGGGRDMESVRSPTLGGCFGRAVLHRAGSVVVNG